RNSVYLFERDNRQALLYQSVRFQVVQPHLNTRLGGNFRVLSSTVGAQPDERFRLYALYVAFKAFGDRITAAAGRLYLHPGFSLGALDGLAASWRLQPQLQLQLYGGLPSPIDRRFGLEWEDRRPLVGATLQAWGGSGSELQLFYLHRFGQGTTLQRLSGVNATYRPLSNLDLHAQMHFDLERQSTQRLLFSARTQWSARLQTNVEYREQQPQIFSDSYFTIFTPRPYQRWRAAASLEVLPEKFLELQAQYVRFEREAADQLYVTFSTAYGEISAVYESGFAGDQFGLCANAFYDLTERLTVSAAVDLTRYRIEQIYAYDRQWSNALRLSYRFSRRLSADLEGQWLNDRLRTYDVRLLNHITMTW
ncbi:MAG: hypothetical protein ONA69_05445, partial [candidate division KSB1 bacterium]|nr:hypothetical protein [candidate division KSB1 bacterium]